MPHVISSRLVVDGVSLVVLQGDHSFSKMIFHDFSMTISWPKDEFTWPIGTAYFFSKLTTYDVWMLTRMKICPVVPRNSCSKDKTGVSAFFISVFSRTFHDFSWLFMTLAVFHDFPGLENGFSKFYDFPGGVVTLDNTFGSVRVCACVCPSICLWALSCLNRLTLIFGMRVDLDLG